jgi:hypothetical protein
VRRLGRWAWNEPWMALTATVGTFCAATLIAIRWLAVIGVVRVYTVTRTSGSLSSYTSNLLHSQVGLASGPSAALSNLDRLTWKLGLLAGIFWMLRLGVRAAAHRIGVLRAIGVLAGFGVFVVTGVMHVVAERVRPVSSRDRINRVITLWCVAAVGSAVLVMVTDNMARASGPATLGDKALAVPVAWSVARSALQLGVALGGWLLAASLTRRWFMFTEWRADQPGAPVGNRA